MSTRGLIGVKEGDEWKTVYNHSDSYPEYLGKMLKKYYNTKEKAEELVGLGDLSFVGEELGQKHDFEKAYKEHPKWTLAYGRDRNETGTNPKTVKSLEDVYNRATHMGAEYVYLFENGKWKAYEVNEKLIPISGEDEKKLVKV